MPEYFLKTLPLIASHPFAIAAYVCLLGASLVWVYRRAKSNDFLSALEKIPQEKRDKFCRESGYKYDNLAHLSQGQRLRLLMGNIYLVAFIALLVAMLLFGLAALRVYQDGQKQAGKVAHEMRKMEEAIQQERIELQHKLDKEQRSGTFLERGLQGAADSARTAARLTQNSELKLHAEKLEQLLREFDSRFGRDRSPELDLSIRLARATIANAKGNYARALDLVPEVESDTVVQRALEANNEALAALMIRASAFYGQQKWSLALTNFSRMQVLSPENFSASYGLGLTFLRMRLPGAALTNFAHAVELCDRLVKEGRNEIASDLAGSLFYRGAAYRDQGKLDEAIRDLTRAVELCERLVKQRRGEMVIDLAGSLMSRGDVYRRQGKPDEAVRDLTRAVEIYEGMGPNEMASLAGSLNNRGDAYRDQGRLVEAILDLNRAVEIYELLVKEGRSEIASYLAGGLTNRGAAYRDQAALAEAIRDLNRAVEIYERLAKEGTNEITNDLARSLTNRGDLEEGKLLEAIRDYDRAVELKRELIETQHQRNLTPSYARVIINRANAYLNSGQFVFARRDCQEVAKLDVSPVHKLAARELLDLLEAATNQNHSRVR